MGLFVLEGGDNLLQKIIKYDLFKNPNPTQIQSNSFTKN
jgi:hypothetical protein